LGDVGAAPAQGRGRAFRSNLFRRRPPKKDFHCNPSARRFWVFKPNANIRSTDFFFRTIATSGGSTDFFFRTIATSRGSTGFFFKRLLPVEVALVFFFKRLLPVEVALIFFFKRLLPVDGNDFYQHFLNIPVRIFNPDYARNRISNADSGFNPDSCQMPSQTS
jgi:hypothetical protein